MIAVGVRDLKNGLSHYLRLVQNGESILVTDHGRVVAELRQADVLHSASLPLAALTQQGAIRWPVEQGDPLADWPTNLALLPPGTASRLIDEDRDDER